jgi:two-component system cell cycle sensor histidine kinase/response regulator CckA
VGEQVKVRAEKLDEHRMLQMLQHLPYFAVMIDRQRRFVWVNRLDPTLTMDQVLGVRVDDYLHPEARAVALEAIERAFTTGDIIRYEAQAYGEGNVESWYGTTIVPLPLNDVGEERALLLSTDVTERHLAEAALRDSERRFRLLTESSPDFVVIVDDELRVTYINRVPNPDGQLVREQLIGMTVAQMTPPAYVEFAEATIRRVLETGEPGVYETSGGLDDRDQYYAVRVLRLSSDGRKPEALVVVTNVTAQREAEAERAQLQAQLQQAQKLESIGQLAGGVAHDLNNILFVIQNHLEFAREAIREGGSVEAEFDAIAAVTARAEAMTRSLLTIGRRQRREAKIFDLRQLVREGAGLWRRAIPESITLEVEIPEQPIVVRADATQVEQILLNLCLNARDAIASTDAGTGRIHVALARCDMAPAHRTGAHGPRPAGRWLSVEIRDTGTGMDEVTMARAFEPFFTTKPVGKGTGLGLSMVHSLVTQNEGRIEVASEVGRGTTFTVYLPEVDERGEPLDRPSPTTLPRARGSGTILVAEDDAGVRTLVARILARAGYTVIEAEDGQRAVDLYTQRHHDIDLVLLDAVMPALRGRDTYEHLVRLRPDVKVLFCTGYAADALPDSFIASRGLTVLTKPYLPETLLDAIHQLLSQ